MVFDNDVKIIGVSIGRCNFEAFLSRKHYEILSFYNGYNAKKLCETFISEAIRYLGENGCPVQSPNFIVDMQNAFKHSKDYKSGTTLTKGIESIENELRLLYTKYTPNNR